MTINNLDLTVDRSKLSLRERAKFDRLQRIIDATQTLLEKNSIDEIAMRDVAELAEVGEATLFRYVSGKDELLLLVFSQRLNELASTIENHPSANIGPESTGSQVVDAVCTLYQVRADVYLEDPKNMTDYVSIAFKPRSTVGEIAVHRGDQFIEVVKALIELGQSNQRLRNDWSPKTIAVNCNALFIHEILRGPTRDYAPDTFRERLETRLRAQLEPLIRTT